MLEVDFKLNWNYKGRRGNETLFHTAIGSLQTSMRDWAPGFRAMRDEVLEPGVREQFDTEGEGSWAPLAPSTVARKGHGMILVDTNEMKSSFFGGPSHVEDIGRQSMKWGSAVRRALFHQTGTLSGFQRTVKGAGRGIPMRKILVLDDKKRRALRSILVQRLATIARREGFAIARGLSPDALTARRMGSLLLDLE